MSSATVTLIVLVIILSLLVMLLLLLLLLLYWRRLRQSVYHHHHHSSLTKSPASSPLAPPRYVASSQLSSVVDCSSELDVGSARWRVGRPLKTIDAGAEEPEQTDEDPCELGGSCSGDSVAKPPLLDAESSASVSCEQLSTLDCDTVDDDDLTSSALRHDDVSVQRAADARHGLYNALCRYSW